jgi:hypothetical protein
MVVRPYHADRFSIQHGLDVSASQHYPVRATTFPVIGLIIDCSKSETDNSPPLTPALLSAVLATDTRANGALSPERGIVIPCLISLC